jgi:hypothetical protein
MLRHLRFPVVWISVFVGAILAASSGFAEGLANNRQAEEDWHPLQGSIGCYWLGAGCPPNQVPPSPQSDVAPSSEGPSSPDRPLRFTLGIAGVTNQFSNTDELRRAQHRPLADSNGNPIADNQTMDHVNQAGLAFLEVFVVPALGVGLLEDSVSVSRSLSAPGRQATFFGASDTGPTYTEKVSIDSSYLTLTWLPWRWEYARIGVLGGVGNATYPPVTGPACVFLQLLFLNCNGGRTTVFHDTKSVSGSTWLAGLYGDMGYRPFAIRVGINYIQASLPSLSAIQPDNTTKTFNVNADRTEYYVGLRTGF